MLHRALRSLLGLPPPRCAVDPEHEWIAMRDGIRLSTLHYWPIDLPGDPPPTVVLRTPYGVRRGSGAAARIGRAIAESGYHVIVQDVRGRYASEGRFTPFCNEAQDGADTLDWLREQSWWAGRTGLLGASYLAYTAYAALSERPDAVQAVSVAIGSGDVYRAFYVGGAFARQNALEWGVGLGERESVPPRRLDLERALLHRPVREADRVALRAVDWYREWVDHPRADDYWSSLRPRLPENPPPTLLFGGWYDLFLQSQLLDHAALGELAGDNGTPPRLVIGPWAHGVPARLGLWRDELIGYALRETLDHFATHLRTDRDASSNPRVRYFAMGGGGWRDAATWPPSESRERCLHLQPDPADEGPSATRNSAARPRAHGLSWSEPDDDEPNLEYVHDPNIPHPSFGGALFGLKGGTKDLRGRAPRSDRIHYMSAPLSEDLWIAGSPRLDLSFDCDREDTDIVATLIDAEDGGGMYNVCDGILRARWRGAAASSHEPAFIDVGEVINITIELGSIAHVFRAGHRIALDIASACSPRFDTNCGTRETPALSGAQDAVSSRQTIHHSAPHGSRLYLPVLESSE